MSSLSPGEYFALATAIGGMGYVVFWTLGHDEKFISIFTNAKKGTIPEVVIRRTFGLLMMGVIPLVLTIVFGGADVSDLGLRFNYSNTFLYWLIGMAIPMLLINFAAGHNANNKATYPQIRKKDWTISTFIIEYGTWIMYLLGYEFLFRGLLLFASLKIMGVLPAVVLNAMIYTLAHLTKGNVEIYGSAILGAFLSYAAIQTGSMWVAFFAHVIMACSNSIFAFALNPEFKYARG